MNVVESTVVGETRVDERRVVITVVGKILLVVKLVGSTVVAITVVSESEVVITEVVGTIVTAT